MENSNSLALKDTLYNLFSTSSILTRNLEKSNQMNNIFDNIYVCKIVNNKDIVSTAELFLNNECNISLAHANSGIHRNTIIYRIEKIQRLIGLNIKDFNDAIIFYNLLTFYRMNIKK